MSILCEHIRDQIRLLEQSIELIDTQLQNSSDPSQVSALTRERKRLLSALQKRRKALAQCEADANAPTKIPPGFADFGAEVSQGIPGHELVSGKDTLVRVFLGIKQPEFTRVEHVLTDEERREIHDKTLLSSPITMLPLLAGYLDRADLVVTTPLGGEFIVDGDIGNGEFTNFSESVSETDNANFYIDGWLLAAAGRYDFKARLYRNGQIVAERPINSQRFQKSGDLRILVVVEIWPFPADKWPVLIEAFREMSRIFPIRAGVAPLNTTAPAGLRYVIEPTPIDFAWPDRTPVAERLAAFNAEQAAANRPDRADHALTIRTQQPGESPIGGNAQSGPNGQIAGVTLNVNPPGDAYFGTLVAHELAHNFLPGTGHDTPAMLNESHAFNLRQRVAVPNPRKLMFNTVADDGNSFLQDDEWAQIRQTLSTRPGAAN